MTSGTFSRIQFFILFAVLLLSVFIQYHFHSRMTSPVEKKRALLPVTVTPKAYRVSLEPNFEKFTFLGAESVDLVVNEATSEVSFHSFDITFDEETVVFTPESGASAKPKKIKFDKENQTVTLSFEKELAPGLGTLSFKFNGVLNDELAGFYRSKYVVNGETRWMATTQFEPTDARRAFPCWDEPAIKAKFCISLTIPSHLTALGNMPVQSTTIKDNKTVVKFQETPVMSTYLVAFLVGEFEHVEGKTKGGVTVRVYTPLGKSHQGKFALDCGTKTLDYFSEYFDIAYPLPKSDMVAIADFSAGAMENWGLITYRETALLCDPNESGIVTKQRVAYVVAHELAHQWFGNIVTMEWWKDLWLNEGFATFVGNQAVHHLFPQWDTWTQFGADYTARAQALDGLLNSHPIEVEVYNSAEINEIFDHISYCKGASVIRMIATHLGEVAFRDGLRAYLKKHAYGNAITNDLWDALSQSSGQDVKTFMDNWTRLTGYPVVRVERQEDKRKFKISQKRFLSSGEPVPEGEDHVWILSIAFVSSLCPEKAHTVVVKGREEVIELPEEYVEQNGKDAEWIKANAGQSGFYRVQYGPRLYAGLIKPVADMALPAIDRMGLQTDMFALTRASAVPTGEYLKLVSSFRSETEYTVWSDLTANFVKLCDVWAEDSSIDELKKFGIALYRPTLDRIGWERRDGESDLVALTRTLVIGKLASFGDEEVIMKLNEMFEGDLSKIPVDLKYTVYATKVKNGGKKEFEKLLQMFRDADMHEEKLRCLRAACATRKEPLMKRALEMSLGDEVRSQDTFYVTGSIATHPAGRNLSWAFLKENFKKFEEKFGGGGFLFQRIIQQVISGFVDTNVADEISNFFDEHPVPMAARTIQQGLEGIRANSAWLSRESQSVASALKDLN